MKKILIILIILSLSGCAFGPEERPGDLRERSMDWPSPRAVEEGRGPRIPVEQR